MGICYFSSGFDFMWYFYGQRRREEFKKALEGALSWNKNKTRAKMVFQSLVVKRKDVLGVCESLIYQLLPKL